MFGDWMVRRHGMMPAHLIFTYVPQRIAEGCAANCLIFKVKSL
jgi:hypothetical protein